jgi:hypothetical protein
VKVVGLNGRTYVWALKGARADRKVSGPHLRCRGLLKEHWPGEMVKEEVPIPGPGRLRADFVLPRRRLIIEVQGRQHENFVPFFHGSLLGFGASLTRDGDKRRWCELNDFGLAELPEGDSDDEWRDIIAGSVGGWRGGGVG